MGSFGGGFTPPPKSRPDSPVGDFASPTGSSGSSTSMPEASGSTAGFPESRSEACSPPSPSESEGPEGAKPAQHRMVVEVSHRFPFAFASDLGPSLTTAWQPHANIPTLCSCCRRPGKFHRNQVLLWPTIPRRPTSIVCEERNLPALKMTMMPDSSSGAVGLQNPWANSRTMPRPCYHSACVYLRACPKANCAHSPVGASNPHPLAHPARTRAKEPSSALRVS